jgi:hypothetical protein
MNRYKPLPHSFEPTKRAELPRENPLLAKEERNKRRNWRQRVARAMGRTDTRSGAPAFAAELSHKPPLRAVRAWLRRWWQWAATRIGGEPQPPAPEVWRMRDPRFWAAARGQATGRVESVKQRVGLGGACGG